jgi:hypothetical protein
MATKEAPAIPAGFERIEAPEPAVSGIPAGFGYLPPISKGDSGGFQGGTSADRGSPATTLPENTRYTAFRPMVDAASQVLKLRRAALACDFEQSDKHSALIARAMEIEASGDEFVIEENPESY